MTAMNPQSRRDFLKLAAATGLSAHLLPPIDGRVMAASAGPRIARGKAENVIYLFLGGGNGQIDTFDPKKLGDPKKKIAGSLYPAINTAVKDVQVCEHLHRTASILDRFALVRTVHHDVIDEHAAAVNRMHTGRIVSGTITYPSIGSIVAHEKGEQTEGMPAYVIMGYPNVTRGPGFLGAKYSYLYLTDTESGPAALSRPETLTPDRVVRREQVLSILRKHQGDKLAADKAVADYEATMDKAFKLSGPAFMSTFDLKSEPAKLRESYGSEFGMRCLLARRLIQRGVRFIEIAHNINWVNGTGWDVHNEGIQQQHVLIDELDRALSTLVRDLEQHKLLDKTVIMVCGEFGRPAQFDGRGGRGHHAKCFSVALAGGGMKLGQAIGESDDLAMNIVKDPVSVPDLFATVFNAIGVNPLKELHDSDRPVPITDQGKPIARLFG